MHRRFMRLSGTAAAAVVVALVPVITASAHAVLTPGKYHVAIGWQFEPPGGSVTYVGSPNAVQVFVDIPTASNPIGTPVSDLNQDCTHPDFQVTVSAGGRASSPLCPEPSFDSDTGLGRMDEYDASLTPTRVGDYTFHIFGTIHGTKIDSTVTSGPSTFDTVGDQSAVEFPAAVPALGDVATKVEQVSSRAASALSSAQNASSSASGATTLAIVAIVVAVLLSGANLLLLMRRRRS